MKDIAVVIPVHNEEDNIEALHTELMGVMNGLGLSYNVIYVNDGSKDASGSMLAHLAEADPNVTMIDFRRNFGQTAAIAAGIDHAHADVVVLMDADLQNDPADIPCLLEEMKNGNYDVVSGWRHNRKDPFITRKVPSMVANWLISVVTGVRLHDYGCTLKAYRREVLDEVRLYGEMHRFIPVYAVAIGASLSEIVVNHRPRIYGRSKYGLMRTGKVFLDLITVKSPAELQHPAHVFVWRVRVGGHDHRLLSHRELRCSASSCWVSRRAGRCFPCWGPHYLSWGYSRSCWV